MTSPPGFAATVRSYRLKAKWDCSARSRRPTGSREWDDCRGQEPHDLRHEDPAWPPAARTEWGTPSRVTGYRAPSASPARHCAQVASHRTPPPLSTLGWASVGSTKGTESARVRHRLWSQADFGLNLDSGSVRLDARTRWLKRSSVKL